MLDYDTLDPGIREIVRKLNALGWNTTDSGDGCSKDLTDPEVLPCAHVAVPLGDGGWGMVADAKMMLGDLRRNDFPAGFKVEATYDPADDSAILLVTWPGPLPGTM
jgi:hypothetical protein